MTKKRPKPQPAPAPEPPEEDIERLPLSGGPRTVANKARFLEVFSHSANVAAACKAVGIGRTQAYHWRQIDPEFDRRWREEAEPEAADVLEAAMVNLALKGSVKRHYNAKGELVYEEIVYYPGLMIHMAKVRDPDRHSERIVAEHRGKNGGSIALDLQGVLRIADQFTEAAKE